MIVASQAFITFRCVLSILKLTNKSVNNVYIKVGHGAVVTVIGCDNVLLSMVM